MLITVSCTMSLLLITSSAAKESAANMKTRVYATLPQNFLVQEENSQYQNK